VIHVRVVDVGQGREGDMRDLKLEVVKTRLPGRGLSNLDVATLTELLQETEKRHGEYAPTAPKHHWSGWYAAYVTAREQGKTPEEAAKQAALHMEGTRERAQV
jgi:hypothetical protein